MISRALDSEEEEPNPAGLIQFETLEDYVEGLAGASTGTWFRTGGRGSVGHAATTVAPFIEADLLRRPSHLVRGGLRADHQSGSGLVFLPRLFAATRAGDFFLSGGAGRFVDPLTNDIFTEVQKNDGFYRQNVFAKGVGFFDGFGPSVSAAEQRILARISPDLARPQMWMLRSTVERRSGPLSTGLEYTWTRGQSLAGSRRVPIESSWMDIVESNRKSRKHQTHARVQYTLRGQALVLHYEWIQSQDDTGGPFAFPERHGDLSAEWAGSTGIPRHNVSLVGGFKLPSSVTLSVVWTARSPSPYNITTGADTEGSGLFNDRGGRPRNSGTGPGFSSLDLFFHRQVDFPGRLPGSGGKLRADVGLEAENLLDTANYLGFGSVVGSPLYGLPWGALPGRSLRFWLKLSR